MKIIALEEHFLTPALRAAWAASSIGTEGTSSFDRGEIEERLDDLGEARIALMDESGIDVQVPVRYFHGLAVRYFHGLAVRSFHGLASRLFPWVVIPAPFHSVIP